MHKLTLLFFLPQNIINPIINFIKFMKKYNAYQHIKFSPKSTVLWRLGALEMLDYSDQEVYVVVLYILIFQLFSGLHTKVQNFIKLMICGLRSAVNGWKIKFFKITKTWCCPGFQVPPEFLGPSRILGPARAKIFSGSPPPKNVKS